MIIDTHCHLDEFFSSPVALQQQISSFDQFKTPVKFLAMSVSADSWNPVLALCNTHSAVCPALGIHPWFIGNSSLDSLNSLESLLQSQAVTAIGEIGLDYSPAYVHSKSQQLTLFKLQLELAERYAKPVSLHVIKAHGDMLATLKRYNVQGVIHGLGSSLQIVQQYIDLGFKIGINAIILRNNARRYHEMVKYLGIDHIVLETDFPNIPIPGLPVPQLSDIMLVAEQVAELLNISIDVVLETTTRNATELFNFNGI